MNLQSQTTLTGSVGDANFSNATNKWLYNRLKVAEVTKSGHNKNLKKLWAK